MRRSTYNFKDPNTDSEYVQHAIGHRIDRYIHVLPSPDDNNLIRDWIVQAWDEVEPDIVFPRGFRKPRLSQEVFNNIYRYYREVYNEYVDKCNEINEYVKNNFIRFHKALQGKPQRSQRDEFINMLKQRYGLSDQNKFIFNNEFNEYFSQHDRYMTEYHDRMLHQAIQIIQGLNYNTVNPHSINRLFSMKSLSEHAEVLSEDERRELYDIYRREHNKRRPQHIPVDLSSYQVIITEQLLTDVSENRFMRGLLPDLDFRRALAGHIPDDILTTHKQALYNYYRKEFTRLRDLHFRPKPIQRQEKHLPYPFQTPRKRNKYMKVNPSASYLVKIPDKKIKPLKDKYMKPNFSPHPYCWEMDHLQYDKNTVPYLFLINVNTRYLYVMLVRDKSKLETIQALRHFISEEQSLNHPVKNIKADGDIGFSAVVSHFPDIHFHLNSSPFTYHNKNVDAVMRTLRDALGPRSNHMWNGRNDGVIQQLVGYYNHTWHRTIKMTPHEMHSDLDLEWAYIRKMIEKLNDVKRKQQHDGLYSYREGDRLMIHLDYGKTNLSFEKRRRRFDVTATFIRYQNGNAFVHANNPINKDIEVPIFFTSNVLTIANDQMIRDTFRNS